MAASVWLLNYDIAAADRDHYLSWFHDEHIPEKLARPGYRWAAHYEALASNDAPVYTAISACLAATQQRCF
jgi:hypothetical protein